MTDLIHRSLHRRARWACIMLAMSMVSAVSGILMDYRVMGLWARARAGTMLQDNLNRADEVATVLLLFTLVVNVACAVVFGVWLARARRFLRGRSVRSAAVAVVLIPIVNPFVPFMVRRLDSGLTMAMMAKAAGVVLAILAIGVVRSLGGRAGNGG